MNRVLVKPCPHAELLKAVDQELAGVAESRPNALPDDFDREHLRLLTDKVSERAERAGGVEFPVCGLGGLESGNRLERDAHSLLDRVCAGARNLLGSHSVRCWRSNRKTPKTAGTYSTASGIEGGRASLGTPDVYAGPRGSVFAQRLPWRSKNADIDGVEVALGPGYPRADTLLGVPLMTPMRVYGWLCVADKLGASGFDADDEKLLSTLGALAGRTYENIRLHSELQRQSAKINRAYAVLSGITQLIVHTRNRQELCQ